ncbi:hypothetical protein RCL1_003390 [Eukaryota sp. TZLM3-RCL]
MSLPTSLTIRRLQQSDFQLGFLELLATLTEVGEVSETKYNNVLTNLPSNIHIFVIQDTEKNKIIGTATLFIETKFVYAGKVGHIEDVVVSPDYRGKNLGKTLTQHLLRVAESLGCTKTTLDCSKHNVGFYERCGLSRNGVQMGIYYH